MPFKLCVVLFLNGFKDSLLGWVKFFQRQKLLTLTASSRTDEQQRPQHRTNKTVNSNEKLLKRLAESCVLNGVFLCLCMLVFKFVLIPILNWIYAKILGPDKNDFITNYFNPFLGLIFFNSAKKYDFNI